MYIQMSKEFPNRWQKFKDLPDESFVSVTYDIIDDRLSYWELPDNICSILRVRDLSNDKLYEHVYKSRPAMTKRIDKYLTKSGGDYEITIAESDFIGVIEADKFRMFFTDDTGTD